MSFNKGDVININIASGIKHMIIIGDRNTWVVRLITWLARFK